MLRYSPPPFPHAHTYIYGVNDASQGRGKGRQARLHDKVTANTLPEQASKQINILPNLSPSTQHIYLDLPSAISKPHSTFTSSHTIPTKGDSSVETLPPSENDTCDQ